MPAARANSAEPDGMTAMNDYLIADLVFPAIRTRIHARFHHAFRSQLFYA